MRKKITALSLLLLSMIGFTANAEVTWSFSIEEGAVLPKFESSTLTISGIEDGIDGWYGSSSWSDAGVYRKSDDSKVCDFGSQWCPYGIEVTDGTATFDLAASYDSCWPDYPVTVSGEYYVKIPNGWFRLSDDTELPEMRVNFSIDNGAFASASDVTITPEAGTVRECPEAWVLTFNNPEITSVAINESAKAQFAQYSWSAKDFTMEVGEDGKSLRLVPTDDIKSLFSESSNYGNYMVYIAAGSLTFNGDAEKTNALMKWDYKIPQQARYRDYSTIPTPGEGDEIAKISSLTDFEVYFYHAGGVITIPEAAQDGSNLPSLQYYDSNLNVWSVVGTFDVTIIPSETYVDEYGYEEQTYPGLHFTLKSEYNVAQFPYGQYKLHIPKAAYIVTAKDEYSDMDVYNEMESQLYEVEYEYAQAPEVSLTPVWSLEQNTKLTEFSEMTVTFKGITTVKYDEWDYENQIKLYRVNDDSSLELLGEMYPGYYDENTWSTIVEPDENGAIRIEMRKDNFDPYWPLNIDGNYKIVLPKGVFQFEGFSSLQNEASEFCFTIENNALVKQQYASIDPAPCEIFGYPEQLTITIDNDAIQTLEVGEVEVEEWDENWNLVTVMKTAQADIVYYSDYGYSYTMGKYNITFDANDPKKVILTPDPASISADAKLSYGEFAFRIPTGALIANKGTETESASTLLEFGKYLHQQRWNASITSPDVAEEQESLKSFTLGLTDDYGYDVYSNYYGFTPKLGTTPPQLFVYDEVRAAWVHHSDLELFTFTDEEGNESILNEDGVIEFGLPYDPVVASGKYKVVLARDAIMFDYYGALIGTTACEAEYTVKSDLKPYTIEVDPAEGEVPFLDDIKVKFTDSWMTGAYIYAWPAENAAAAINAEGEIVAYANMSSNYADDWSIYHLIDFEPAINEPGEYRVVVASDVICTDYDGIGDNEGFSFNYTVTGGDPILSVNPEDGSTVKEISKVEFTWAGATSLEINEDLAEGAKLYNVVEGENVFVSNLTAEASDYKHASLTVADLTAEMPNGQYVVEVPAGLFTVNGKTTEAMLFNYTLEAVVFHLEDKGETPLAKLFLTAENSPCLKVAEDCAEEITLYYVTGGEKEVGTYTVENVVENTCDLILSADAEILDGDYVVVIPAEYFWTSNYDINKEARIAISDVVSVESIEDDANFDIYSVNGMIIKRNGNKADLKALDPGIYVVNGKKVFVK